MATILSRSQEKEQLQNLNDRFSTYIDKVRQLEYENQRLHYQVCITEETTAKERKNIKVVYEAELADARRLLDETAKEKAKLHIEAGKYKIQYDELNARIKKLEDNLKLSEDRRMCYESQVQDLTACLNTADLQRKHWEDTSKNLRKENVELRNQLESVRKQLGQQTLLRIDAENRVKSLDEEFHFNKQLFEQELEETRFKRQTEITEVNAELEGQYKTLLQDGLQQMRRQLSIQLETNRREIEEYYERKIQAANEARDRAILNKTENRDELKRLSAQIEKMEKERTNYSNLVNELQKKIQDLEMDLQQENETHCDAILQKEDEIRDLRDEIQEMIKDYQDLMDTKIQLDVEIEAYRRLLESEENRLCLTVPSLDEPPKLRQSLKRPQRREIESSWKTLAETKGDIEIIEHDINGQFVRLHNKGIKNVVIGGWQLKSQADDGEIICYKFYRQSTLKAGATVTVWSANSGVTHCPPTDYVMKKEQQWPTGMKMRTWLVDGEGGKELTFRESIVHNGEKIRRYSYSTDLVKGPGSALHTAGTDQRCSIM